MTANGIKVLEAMAKAPNFWWLAHEIAKAAGLNPRGMGGILHNLRYRDGVLHGDYQHQARAFVYQINEKGLEIARAS